jgi:serine/threonine-protein kinase
MSEETPKRIGDYEILGVLGSGGMGQVFKVRNVISERIEAMKILLPDLAGRQDLADRFLREIKLLAGLSHPNIAALRTALTLDNQLVMVMEYVECTTLATRLELGPIP